MSSFQLRHFNFYNCNLIEEVPDVLQEDNINLFGTSEELIVTDSLGNLNIFDQQLKLLLKYQLYDEDGYNITFFKYLNQDKGIVLTIGERQVSENNNENSPILKVWDLKPSSTFLNRTWNRKNQPYLIKSVKLNSIHSKLTCISISLNHLCIGTLDGQVLLVKGNLIKDRFIKQKIIHTCTESITGLGFNDNNQEDNNIILFIITKREILSCSLEPIEIKNVLDDQGCNLNCASMVHNTFHNGISMAREDAIYFYDADGRGPCLAYEGIKSSISWYNNQLVVLSPLMNAVQSYKVGDNIEEQDRIKSKKMEIYDVQQKLISFSQPFDNLIKSVIFAFNKFIVLCNRNQLYIVEEKEVQVKLDILLKQDLFQLAILIAKQTQFNQSSNSIHPQELANIYKKYGDFLYFKGEFDEAMDQYINTIGYLEPSYVIRKFLDAQRLQSLTYYLQSIHSYGNGLANPDHTTLLLNCYTKLKEKEKLEKFIKQSTEFELKFDLETTIKVLRQANYFDQALYLSNKYNQHDWSLKILIEDKKDYEKGLEYFHIIENNEKISYILEYGRTLLKHLHTPFIQILLNLSEQNDPLKFNSLFNDLPIYYIMFLETYCKQNYHVDLNNVKKHSIINYEANKEHENIWNTLLELYLSNLNSKDLFNNDSTLIHNKILFILESDKIYYDLNFAMVLCRLYHFDEGLIKLYEKLELYSDILNHFIQLSDVPNMLETLNKYGFKDVHLYNQTLDYFSKSNSAILNYPIEFRKVLEDIDQHNLLPPLQVIQALSRNSIATIGNLKPFILKSIKQDLNSIEKDQVLNQTYLTENENKEAELDELRNNVKIFQHTKCSSCSNSLDLPLIHFLCKHSYHVRCLGQNTEHCPICFDKDQQILKLQQVLEEETLNPESLLEEIDEDDQPIDLVYQLFSKNSMRFLDLES